VAVITATWRIRLPWVKVGACGRKAALDKTNPVNKAQVFNRRRRRAPDEKAASRTFTLGLPSLAMLAFAQGRAGVRPRHDAPAPSGAANTTVASIAGGASGPD